ncbi:MAG: hypothetical protein VKJ46_06895 [Leptolyngbyaceae bacterium]|nr:hypothetical protein [Leptolyngbyaceae bacterium]
MDRKIKEINRPLMLFVACSVAGAIVGGTANWIESRQCLQATTLTNQCLMQSPLTKTIAGMGSGLLAGAGAALGATWQLRQKQG